MPEFWAYLQEYIEQLPLTDEDHEKATSFGWGGFSRLTCMTRARLAFRSNKFSLNQSCVTCLLDMCAC